MAIAYRAGSGAGEASGTNLTVNKPTGTADGDILIAVLYREGGTWTLPSGWAQWGSDQRDSGNNIYVTVAWKRASSEGSSWTFNLSTTTWRTIAIAAYSGALESGDPIDVGPTGNNGSINAVSAASITTATANAMRIVVKADYFSSDVAVGSSGMTKGINYGGCQHFYLIQASAGSSGTKTFGEAGTQYWATFHLAIKPATGAGAQTITPNAISSAASVYSPTVTPGSVTIAPNAIASGVTMYAPTITTGAVTIAPNAISSTVTVYAVTVTVGGATLVPETIPSAAQVYAPTITPGAVTIAPNAISSVATVYTPTVTPGSVTIAPNTIASTSQVYAPSVGDTTKNYNVQVGDGYTDVSPKQLVRTSSNYLYTIAPNCDSYPDYSANGLTQTIRVHKANNTGIPTGFTRKDSSNEPAAINGCAAALDSDDNIRIVWAARNTSSNTRYLRYAVFNTSTDTWGSVTTIASDLDYDDWGQGDQSVAVAVDASDVVHVVYLGTAGDGSIYNRRIYYRNNSGGTWSSATQIDSDVSHTSNLLAWHPSIAFDDSGNIVVAYLIGGWYESQNAIIYSRVYSGGSWGSSVQVSAAGDNVACSIDQSTSLLITPDGTCHLAYMLYSATNSQKYIQYRYSTNDGASWSGNNPTNQATHNPSLGWTGSKVRILAHGTPDGSNHGENLYYFEGDGGSAAWGSWTQFVIGTNYDSSVNIRWSQYNHHFPHTFDIAYWNDAYPNVLYAGTELFALDIVPDTIASVATVYTPTVTLGAVTIAPDAIASTAQAYSFTVTVGAVTITPDTIASAATVHGVTITAGSVTVSPNAIASAAQVYQPTVTVGTVTILPVSIASTVTVYEPTITVGSVTIAPDAIASTAQVYELTVTASGTLIPDTIASTAQVYQPAIVPGAIGVTPDTITSTATVHAVTVTIGAVTITPDAIASAAQVYGPTIAPGAVAITPDAIASTTVVYSPFIGTGIGQTVYPDAIASVAHVYLVAILTIAAGRIYRTAEESRTVTVAAESRTFSVEE